MRKRHDLSRLLFLVSCFLAQEFQHVYVTIPAGFGLFLGRLLGFQQTTEQYLGSDCLLPSYTKGFLLAEVPCRSHNSRSYRTLN